MKSMTIRRLIKVMFGLALFLMAVFVMTAVLAYLNNCSLVKNQDLRARGFDIADELRHSSDDLTRFVRTYVVTGDSRYERYYREVLDIRNGVVARPVDYNHIYWDFVSDAGYPEREKGEAKPLRKIMEEAGFSESELELLKSSQNNSDQLVSMEEEAMHAVKGEYKDADGKFTRKGAPDRELAINLLYSKDYHREKARIMAPINQFLEEIQARTAAEESKYSLRNTIFLHVMLVVAVLLMALVAVSYFLVRRRILLPVEGLKWQTQTVAADMDNLDTIVRQFAQGDYEHSFEVLAPTMDLRYQDEVGELAQLHNDMIHHIQETGKSIATLAANLSLSNDTLEKENSKRRAAEKSLENERSLLKALLDSIPDMVFFKDLKGTYLGCNPAFVRFVGKPEREIVSKTDYDLFAKDVADSFRQNDAQMLPDGTGRHNDEWISYPDGSKALIDTLKAPLRNSAGEVVGLLGVSRDITQRKKLEEQLLSSEKNYRLFFETMDDMVCIANLQGNIIYANNSLMRKLGYSLEELAKMTVLDTHSAQGRAELQSIFAEILAGRMNSCPIPLQTKQGVLIPVETRAWIGEWSGAQCIFGISKDLSREQEALQRFHKLFHNSPAMMALTQLPGRTFVDVNQSFLNGIGYSREEVVGRSVADIGLYLRSEQNERLARAIAEHSKLVNMELQLRTKEGGVVDGLLSGEFIESQGKQYFLSVMVDISERKRVEQEMRKLLRSIESSPASIVITDRDANIEYVNPTFVSVTGYSREEVLGKNPRILNSGLTPRSTFVDLWNTILAGKDWEGEFHNRKKNGEVFWEYAYISPVKDAAGNITNFTAVKEDISKRKLIEADLVAARDAALRAEKAKAEFLAVMSHEIRTPMNAIIGMTGILLETDLTTEQRMLADTVRNSGDYLLNIINDILDFSKIEAGKLVLEKTTFDLRQLVESSVDLLSVRAHEKGLDIASTIAPGTPLSLVGDPGKLRQAIINLLGNAVKFTASGYVFLQVEVVSREGGTVMLRVRVADTGIGLAKESIPNLFNSFTQADASTTRKFGGTGLGLAISKKIIEMMGGKIGVDSEQGKGSTFWIELPLEESASPEVALPPLPANKSAKILVADTGPVTGQALSSLLTELKVDFRQVLPQDVVSELKAAAKSAAPFGLVLLGENQLAVIKAIKAEPELSGIRVVLLGRSGKVLTQSELFDSGANAVLTRPVKLSALQNCVFRTGTCEIVARPAAVSSTGLKSKIKRAFFRILLAEDNTANQLVAKMQLNSLGYEADIVANGLEALAALERIPYDLVLMDCQMPEMDGFSATKELRNREGGRKHTPVVAMTANALSGDKERCLASGMDDYVAKPVRVEELKAAISRWDMDFNPEPLAKLKEMAGESDAALVEQVKREFLKSTSETLAKLKLDIESGDVEGVRNGAHSLKGSAGNMGAVALHKIAARLEHLARSGKLDGARQWLAMLEEGFASVRGNFES